MVTFSNSPSQCKWRQYYYQWPEALLRMSLNSHQMSHSSSDDGHDDNDYDDDYHDNGGEGDGGGGDGNNLSNGKTGKGISAISGSNGTAKQKQKVEPEQYIW